MSLAQHPLKTIAIIGGGYTGAAIAFHLARAQVAARIKIFEPRALLGGGLAYDDSNPVHRINVPATRMTLVPADPEHFQRWLDAAGALDGDGDAWVGGAAFPARQIFGRYVHAHLQPLVDAGRIEWIAEKIVAVDADRERWRLTTESGAQHGADLVALAATHNAPRPPRELLALVGDPKFAPDALAKGALDEIGLDERILVVGTGLTAADVVCSLAAKSHRGPITMISRRGLRARGHAPVAFPAEGDFSAAPSRQAVALLRRIRAAIRDAETQGRSWHSVLDAVRAQGPAIWAGLDPAARRRVVRHLRPFWDVHRFRSAPQVEAALDRKLADGSLKILRARLGASRRAAEGLVVTLKTRAGERVELFDRVIVATGPAHGDSLNSQKFLGSLAAEGFVGLDPSGLGLKTSRRGRAINVQGREVDSLFIAGPLARGTFGELMGLPQVSDYAFYIAEEIFRALHGATSREYGGAKIPA